MILIILGPQGCGKGTQAKILAKEKNLIQLSTGDILREMAKNDQHISSVLASGDLLDDNFVVDALKKYLESNQINDNFIFDGSPRTLRQYDLIKEYLALDGRKIDYAFYLSLPDEEVVRRLSARRQDKITGEIYNLITNPPPLNVLKENLEIREDDKPEAIKHRLELYHKNTEPVLVKLENDNILQEIDGTLSIEEIASKIRKIIS